MFVHAPNQRVLGVPIWRFTPRVSKARRWLRGCHDSVAYEPRHIKDIALGQPDLTPVSPFYGSARREIQNTEHFLLLERDQPPVRIPIVGVEFGPDSSTSNGTG